MKKSLVVILMALVVIACGPEEKETKYPDGSIKERYEFTVDDNGSELKNGEYRLFYPNGQVRSKGAYIDNKESGEWTVFYDNGNIKQIHNAKEGKRDGELIFLRKNGDTAIVEHYKAGVKDGLQKKYYDGNVLRSAFGISGEEYDGVVKHYYENGNIKSYAKYDSGSHVGEEVWYHENGNKHRRYVYESGKKNGVGKEWNEEGKLIKEMKYVDGVSVELIGKWKADNGYVYEFDDEGYVSMSKNGRSSKKSYQIGMAVLQMSYNRYNVEKLIDDELVFIYDPVFGADVSITAKRL